MKADWSNEQWKDRLILERKSLWPSDTVEMLANWMGLERGMTVADIGCGLGYLGWTYWPYFGRGGRYVGVDNSEKLLRDAREAAGDWAIDGHAEFLMGDAYRLPIPDDYADCAMCQTLLMHLERPEDALSEMIRVVKPGGIIICKEPNNLSWWLGMHHSSLPQIDIEDQLLYFKVYLLANSGRKKLGRGDNSIGSQIAPMMSELGLRDVDVRINDQVGCFAPPYDTEDQKSRIEDLKKARIDKEHREFWLGRLREEFIAGGGESAEFDRFKRVVDERDQVLAEQLANEEYHYCGMEFFFVARGRKRA